MKKLEGTTLRNTINARLRDRQDARRYYSGSPCALLRAEETGLLRAALKAYDRGDEGQARRLLQASKAVR